MLEKLKLSFDVGSITIKANIELSEKETEKYPRNVFTFIIVWMVILEFMIGILEQTHKQLKEREKPFDSTGLKLCTH